MLTKCSAYVSFKSRIIKQHNEGFPFDRKPYVTTGVAETPQGNVLTHKLIQALIGAPVWK